MFAHLKDWTTVYANPWIKVVRKDGFHSVINTPSGAGVSVLLCDDDGSILMVRVNRWSVDAYPLELPRGGTDIGETHLQSAVRETREETGLDLDPATFVDLGPIHADAGVLAMDLRLFAVRVPGVFGDIPFVSEEVKEIKTIRAAQIDEMIKSGEIVCAISITNIIKARLAGII